MCYNIPKCRGIIVDVDLLTSAVLHEWNWFYYNKLGCFFCILEAISLLFRVN